MVAHVVASLERERSKQRRYRAEPEGGDSARPVAPAGGSPLIAEEIAHVVAEPIAKLTGEERDEQREYPL
jgi:hypothetical protein